MMKKIEIEIVKVKVRNIKMAKIKNIKSHLKIERNLVDRKRVFSINFFFFFRFNNFFKLILFN